MPKFDMRLPITLHLLHKITGALDHCSQSLYQRTMYKNMFLLAFAAFLRIGLFWCEIIKVHIHSSIFSNVKRIEMS